MDLDRVEHQLLAEGLSVRLVGDHALHAFVTQPRLLRKVRDRVSALAAVPPGAVQVHHLASFPSTTTGKCDYAALGRHATAATATASQATTSIHDLYAVALGRTAVAGSDTFTSLGGDSLSFVEVSSRLARHLGHLPRDWPHQSIDELTRTAAPEATVHDACRDRGVAARSWPS